MTTTTIDRAREKTCRGCDLTKPLTEFHLSGRRGTEQRRPRCRACTNRGPEPIDQVAVLRAVAGSPPKHLSIDERAAAVAELTARGLGASTIAVRVHATPRTVHRIRTRLGLTVPTCPYCTAGMCRWHALEVTP